MAPLRPYIFSPSCDTEHTTLRANGRTGSLPDMQVQELLAAGFTGALPDLFKQLAIFGLVAAVSETRIDQLANRRVLMNGLDARVTQGS